MAEEPVLRAPRRHRAAHPDTAPSGSTRGTARWRSGTSTTGPARRTTTSRSSSSPAPAAASAPAPTWTRCRASAHRGGEAEPAERLRPAAVPTRRPIPKPVIAAINGACAGIGMVQALMCDLRFAAAGAKFTTAFARRGPHRRVRLVVDPAPPGRSRPRDGPVDVGPRVPRRGGRRTWASSTRSSRPTSSMAALGLRQDLANVVAVVDGGDEAAGLGPLPDGPRRRATEASNDLMRQSLRADDFPARV